MSRDRRQELSTEVINESIANFLNNKSKKTQYLYKKWINLFLTFIKQDDKYLMSMKFIDDFMKHIIEKYPSYESLAFSAVRGLLKYMFEKYTLQDDAFFLKLAIPQKQDFIICRKL